jgi:hypothetical protein
MEFKVFNYMLNTNFSCQADSCPVYPMHDHHRQACPYNPLYIYLPHYEAAYQQAMHFQAQQIGSVNPHIAQTFARLLQPIPQLLPSHVLHSQPSLLAQHLCAHPLPPIQPSRASQPVSPSPRSYSIEVNREECQEESPEQELFAEGIVSFLEKEEKISEAMLEKVFGRV